MTMEETRTQLTDKNINPIKDQILVEYKLPDTQSTGKHGIKLHLPDIADKDSRHWGNEAKVIAVGSEVVDVKPGDRILFKRRGGTAVDPDLWNLPIDERGKVLLVLRCPAVETDKRPSDVLAVIEGVMQVEKP
jgi:co-chaperonin GroES (HSP10)